MNAAASDSGNTLAGIRWYELRNLTGKLSDVQVYQQGTYAPDNTWRWMGTMAMDRIGNIALGYSMSSSSMYPSLGITGKTPNTALSKMNVNETVVKLGTGSQTAESHRW